MSIYYNDLIFIVKALSFYINMIFKKSYRFFKAIKGQLENLMKNDTVFRNTSLKFASYLIYNSICLNLFENLCNLKSKRQKTKSESSRGWVSDTFYDYILKPFVQNFDKLMLQTPVIYGNLDL